MSTAASEHQHDVLGVGGRSHPVWCDGRSIGTTDTTVNGSAVLHRQWCHRVNVRSWSSSVVESSGRDSVVVIVGSDQVDPLATSARAFVSTGHSDGFDDEVATGALPLGRRHDFDLACLTSHFLGAAAAFRRRVRLAGCESLARLARAPHLRAINSTPLIGPVPGMDTRRCGRSATSRCRCARDLASGLAWSRSARSHSRRGRGRGGRRGSCSHLVGE
jgi:hypothetical protein